MKPSVDPVRWTPPPAAPPTEPVAPTGLAYFPVGGHGPEDVAVAPDGRVVTAVEDGRLLAVDPETGSVETIAEMGARPLGVEPHPEGGWVVCATSRGVLRVTADGTVTELATSHDGVPFRLVNNSAVANDGTIWFTDSTTRFAFDHWTADIIEHSATGRLFRLDVDGTLTLVLDGLAFANGVALAPDGRSLVVAECGSYLMHRVHLVGDRAGAVEPFADPLPGFPDNVSTGDDGLLWVAIPSPRNSTLDRLWPKAPWIRKAIWALPEAVQPKPARLIQLRAYDFDGALVHDISGEHPEFGMVTGVRQTGDHVWLGGVQAEGIARCDVPPRM